MMSMLPLELRSDKKKDEGPRECTTLYIDFSDGHGQVTP